MDEEKTSNKDQQAVTTTQQQAVPSDVLIKPRYPKWPTSHRGPQVTEPPPGQKRLPKRTDQVMEVGYNQEIGMPSVLSAERSNPDASQRGVLTHEELDKGQELSVQQEETGPTLRKAAEKDRTAS